MHERVLARRYLIINEIFQVHHYIGEILAPIVEQDATTCFSKEWFPLLCTTREAKAKYLKVQDLSLSYEGLLIRNDIDSLVSSWIFNF